MKEYRRFHFKAEDRTQRVLLASELARIIPPAFFTNPDTVGLVNVYNGYEKSMFIEAMMKTILDQKTPYNMLRPWSKHAMYLEKKECDALGRYLITSGTAHNHSVYMAFDRFSGFRDYEYIENFQQAALEEALKNRIPRITRAARFNFNKASIEQTIDSAKRPSGLIFHSSDFENLESMKRYRFWKGRDEILGEDRAHIKHVMDIKIPLLDEQETIEVAVGDVDDDALKQTLCEKLEALETALREDNTRLRSVRQNRRAHKTNPHYKAAP